eukprot:363140-Chlamydomonas_euryale.AAC.2
MGAQPAHMMRCLAARQQLGEPLEALPAHKIGIGDFCTLRRGVIPPPFFGNTWMRMTLSAPESDPLSISRSAASRRSTRLSASDRGPRRCRAAPSPPFGGAPPWPPPSSSSSSSPWFSLHPESIHPLTSLTDFFTSCSSSSSIVATSARPVPWPPPPPNAGGTPEPPLPPEPADEASAKRPASSVPPPLPRSRSSSLAISSADRCVPAAWLRVPASMAASAPASPALAASSPMRSFGTTTLLIELLSSDDSLSC